MSDLSDSGEKVCTSCGERKPLSGFYYNKNRRHYNHSCKPCHNAYVRNRRMKNPAQMMWINARLRAKRDGVPFSIAEEDIILPDTCPICGVVMVILGDRRTSPSLDRIVPVAGYTPENMVVICFQCNTRKNDSTPELMYAIADYIYRIREERGLC